MPYAGGSGTQADPYQIETWEHLHSIRDNQTAYFILNNTIDSNTEGYLEYASSNANSGNGWQPIIQGADRFEGELDGNGYVVKDLYIDRTSENNVGFFGYVGTGSLVTNFGLVNIDVSGGQFNTGGLVGSHDGGTITKCFTTGSVSGTEDVGGLIGDDSQGGTTNKCYSACNVTGSDGVGGLIGAIGTQSLSDSYSVGPVSAPTESGGLVGRGEFGSFTDCYFDTENSGQSDGLGDSTSSGVTGLTTSQMQGSSASANMSGLDFSGTWTTIVSSDTDAQADGYPILSSIDRDQQLRGFNNWTGPTAAFTLTPTSPSVSEIVELDASTSTDNGSISTYEWDYTDDGTFEDTGQTSSNQFESSGTTRIRLRVTDNDGLVDELVKTVDIQVLGALRVTDSNGVVQTLGNGVIKTQSTDGSIGGGRGGS